MPALIKMEDSELDAVQRNSSRTESLADSFESGDRPLGERTVTEHGEWLVRGEPMTRVCEPAWRKSHEPFHEGRGWWAKDTPVVQCTKRLGWQ